jgi:adenylyltransferase/sulfurtransferase
MESILTPEELRRYSRHLLLPEVGVEGQTRLRAASVLCVGAGGLGSPVLLYLAAAGVGRIGIVDFDQVDVSNLQRQVLHGTPDVGRLKTESARAAIQRLNPNVEVVIFSEKLTRQNTLEILKPFDVVVDGTDNFVSRYLVNDACVMLGKPNVYGAVFRFEGQASLFAPSKGGPCYRCLFPDPPPPGAAPSCAEAGVLGMLPGIIGCLQATEVLKWILGQGESLAGRLLVFDALRMSFKELKIRRDPHCPVCGAHPTITKLVEIAPVCALNTPMNTDEVSIEDLKKALTDPGRAIHIADVREPDEYQACHIDGVPLLPLSQLAQRHGELNPAQPIYLFCKAGGRSFKAVQFLKQHGYSQVKSVRGGITAWIEAGGPTVNA